MNPRERRLALLVGLLGTLALVIWVGDTLYGQFSRRRRTITALEKRIDHAEQTQRTALDAKQRIEAYEQRSLPADDETARSLYKRWLLDRVAELGFQKPNVSSSGGVSPVGPRVNPTGQEPAFREISFRLTALGTMDQLTQFLYHFYKADQLHRIGQLTIQPEGDSNLVNFDLRADALILPGSACQELKLDGARRLSHPDLADYLAQIAKRNLFASTNLPPKLDKVPEQKGEIGKPLEVKLQGSDPNGGDTLRYELENAPESLAVESPSGKLTWTPDRTGRFAFQVVVYDNGSPPLSARQEVVIVVADSADAQATEVGGYSEGKRRLLWLKHTPSGKTYLLEEGEKLQIESIQGKVLEIQPYGAILQIGKRTIQVHYGQKLSEGVEVGNQDDPAAGSAPDGGSPDPGHSPHARGEDPKNAGEGEPSAAPRDTERAEAGTTHTGNVPADKAAADRARELIEATRPAKRPQRADQPHPGEQP